MEWPPLKIKYFEDEAEGFKEIIDYLIFKLLEYYNPEEVAVIRIKNWFDHKWLNYSGKRVELNEKKSHPPHIPFVLEPFWNEEITIPPFNPNRVLSETYYKIDGNHNSKFTKPFHIYQISGENLKKGIEERTSNGLCFWISTNSMLNRQGCLMAYHIKDGETESWYVNLKENGIWKINQTKGVSKDTLQRMLMEFY